MVRFRSIGVGVLDEEKGRKHLKDLKGVDPTLCQHTIPLQDDAKPSRQTLKMKSMP